MVTEELNKKSKDFKMLSVALGGVGAAELVGPAPVGVEDGVGLEERAAEGGGAVLDWHREVRLGLGQALALARDGHKEGSDGGNGTARGAGHAYGARVSLWHVVGRAGDAQRLTAWLISEAPRADAQSIARRRVPMMPDDRS